MAFFSSSLKPSISTLGAQGRVLKACHVRKMCLWHSAWSGKDSMAQEGDLPSLRCSHFSSVFFLACRLQIPLTGCQGTLSMTTFSVIRLIFQAFRTANWVLVVLHLCSKTWLVRQSNDTKEQERKEVRNSYAQSTELEDFHFAVPSGASTGPDTPCTQHSRFSPSTGSESVTDWPHQALHKMLLAEHILSLHFLALYL